MDVDGSGNDRQIRGSRKRRHHESEMKERSNISSAELLQLIEHPNFDELARWNPRFQKAWSATVQRQKDTKQTFSACVTQEFTIALTQAILRNHLDLHLPFVEEEHLCPPVPNRFFFLHWIHTALLNGASSRFGLDIGAGATAIYSLLAAKFFSCNMFTTEIDSRAVEIAQKNIEANNLNSSIHVSLVQPSHSQDATQPPGGPLERALSSFEAFLATMPNQQPIPSLDFVMTNPPFYDPSSVEHSKPRAGDGRARTSMTVSEGNYPGGEVGFVTEMFVDSLKRRHSAKWFSSMFGKKSSFEIMHKMMTHVLGPAHVRVTEFGPGQYTRWFLAWTFERPVCDAPCAQIALPGLEEGFSVRVSNETSDPISEVVSRIVSFCQASPRGWSFQAIPLSSSLTNSNPPFAIVQIQESTVHPVAHFVDESDPQCQHFHVPSIVMDALRGVDNTVFLPLEGHFMIRITVEARSVTECHVWLAAFCHSLRGHTAIKKITSTIQGEVCRTNRFWRRKLQREQQQMMD